MMKCWSCQKEVPQAAVRCHHCDALVEDEPPSDIASASELSKHPADVHPVDFAAQKRRIIHLLLGYSAVFGIISSFLPEENGPLDLVLTLPFLFLGFAWCVTDADEHGRRIGRLLKLMIILMFIVGFPLYIFRAHGIRGFKILFLTAVLAAIMLVCAIATGLVTLYVVGVIEV